MAEKVKIKSAVKKEEPKAVKVEKIKPIIGKFVPPVKIIGIPEKIRSAEKENELYISDGSNIKGLPEGILVRDVARIGKADKRVDAKLRGKEIYCYFFFGKCGCIIFPHGTEFAEIGSCLV